MGRAGVLFEQALAVTPDDPELLLDSAQMLFRDEKLPEARGFAEKALRVSPDHARAQLVLGQVLFAQKDYKAAREHLEAAVVATPTFETGYLLG
jgi:tetratricopeptide (TPR) repeat protein